VGTFWVRWDAEGDTPPLDMGRGDGHPNYYCLHSLSATFEVNIGVNIGVTRVSGFEGIGNASRVGGGALHSFREGAGGCHLPRCVSTAWGGASARLPSTRKLAPDLPPVWFRPKISDQSLGNEIRGEGPRL